MNNTTFDKEDQRKAWEWVLVCLSTIIILFVTLYPFNFVFDHVADSTWREIVIRFQWGFNRTTVFTDLPRNIFLFLPFGFSVRALLGRTPVDERWYYVIPFALGFALSCGVEFLQVFQFERFPSISDIVANSFGSILGGLSFHLWGNRILNIVARRAG